MVVFKVVVALQKALIEKPGGGAGGQHLSLSEHVW